MYNYGRESSKELWAIVNNDDEIMWSMGGSSTNPKLLVYSTESKARAQFTSLIKRKNLNLISNIHVKLVYSVSNHE